MQFNKTDTAGGFEPTTLITQLKTAGLNPSHIEAQDTTFEIFFSTSLTSEQEDLVTSTVSSHNGITSAQSLAIYLDTQIFPFVQELIREFAAENISLGITQAGKTGHVLAMFSKNYPVPDNNYQNSLKNSFDTGSLYISLGIIAYLLANSSEYDGLSPYITSAKLTTMYNKIATKLGAATI